MHENTFRRHDLVWLAPDRSLAELALQASDRELAARWIARRLPFVVARRDEAVPGLRLGFTLPGTGPRRRIGLQAPHTAIIRHEPAPQLDHLLAYAPRHWQDGLVALARDFSNAGLAPRVFGSLVTQAYSGETCLRPESDLDLMIACSGKEDVLAALDVLRRHGPRSPRVDAELCLQGRAASWRELDQVLACRQEDRRLLMKTDTAARLMPVEEFLEIDT